MIGSRIRAVALLVWTAAIAVAGAGEPSPVRVHDTSFAWPSTIFLPVSVSVTPGAGGRIHTTLASPGWQVRLDRSVPPGERLVTLEGFSAPDSPAYLTWSYQGREGRERVPVSYHEYSLLRGEGIFLTCIDGVMLAGIEGLGEDERPDGVTSLPGDLLPRRWQSYAGFRGVLVLDGRAAGRLSQERKAALVMWVRWLGGRLWLTEVAAMEELSLSETAGSPVAGGVLHRLGWGHIYVQDSADAAMLVEQADLVKQADPLGPLYSDTPYSGVGERLRENLGGVSAGFITVCLAVLGLLLGPVNYWYARKRNILLFYVATPILAGIGTAAIFAGSMLVEGFDSRFNQVAVLARSGEGEGMMFDLRMVRAGMVPPILRFPEDTLAIPLDLDPYGDGVVVDISDGVVLESGWLKPRFATGYFTVRPVAPRLGIEVTRVGGEWRVVNGLGFTLRQVAVRLPAGRTGWAEEVPAGGEAALRSELGDHRMTAVTGQLAKASGLDTEALTARIVARVAGLPYEDDGGLGGRRLEGEYYYLDTATGDFPEGGE